MNKLLFSTIKQANKELKSGTIKASELCDAALNRVEKIKPLNAFINVTKDLAERQSKNADARYEAQQSLGPLDGIPIAIKDNFCVKDEPTTCASLMLSNFRPGYDATVYKRLQDSGAVLIGKTNLDQFAMGTGTIDSYYGPSKNPWGLEVLEEEKGQNADWHIAGGSSGGSAIAVASGACFGALGSDTGGSTRNPAAYCGVVGLKPTYGLVSRSGLIPLVNSMDVPGILARTVDDAAVMLNAIAGFDPMDSTSLEETFDPVKLPDIAQVSNLRIGIPKEYFTDGLSEEVKDVWKTIARLLEEGGATISPVSMPHTDLSIVCYSVLNQCEVASNMARYDGIEYGYRAEEDSSAAELYAKTRSQALNDVVRSRILTGNYFLLEENHDEYFVKAMKIRRLIAEDFDRVWQSVDLLLTPTTLTDAPTFREYTSHDNQTQCSIQDYCTQPANMAGVPAVNIPIALSSRRLPLSLQLIGPNLSERTLLVASKWIEQSVNFPRFEA